MKHFSSEEWKAFYLQEGGYNEEEMEKHLLECEICNRVFLEQIDELLSELEIPIPAGFSSDTMRYVRHKNQVLQKRSKRSIRNRLIASYAVAASLTLMLMGGGVFGNYSGEINRISRFQSSAVPLQITSFFNNWTTQVRNSTWDWIEKIPFREGQEVRR